MLADVDTQHFLPALALVVITLLCGLLCKSTAHQFSRAFPASMKESEQKVNYQAPRTDADNSNTQREIERLHAMTLILQNNLPVCSTYGGQNFYWERNQHYVRPPEMHRAKVKHTDVVPLREFLSILEYDENYIWVIDKFGDMYVCKEFIHYENFPEETCPYCYEYVRQEIAKKRADDNGVVQIKHGDLVPASTQTSRGRQQAGVSLALKQREGAITPERKLRMTQNNDGVPAMSLGPSARDKKPRATEKERTDHDTTPNEASQSRKPNQQYRGANQPTLPPTTVTAPPPETPHHGTMTPTLKEGFPALPEPGDPALPPTTPTTARLSSDGKPPRSRSNSDPHPRNSGSSTPPTTDPLRLPSTPPLSFVKRIPSKSSLRYDKLVTFHPNKSCFHGEFRGSCRAGGEMILRRGVNGLVFELNSRSGYSLNRVSIDQSVPIPIKKADIRSIKGQGEEVDYDALGQYLSLMFPGFPPSKWCGTYFQKKDHRKYYKMVELHFSQQEIEVLRAPNENRWRYIDDDEEDLNASVTANS